MHAKRQTRKPTAADRIAGQCLAGRVRLLSRAITGIYDEALQPLELTAGQLNMLVMVARRQPIAPTRLARRLSMDKSTASRNLERLRQRGWVAVSAGDDGRQRLLKTTSSGRRLLEKALPLWQQAQRRASRLLGPDGADAIHTAVGAIMESSLDA